MGRKSKAQIEKEQQTKKRTIKTKLIILLLLVVAMGVSLIWKAPIEKFLNYKYNGGEISSSIDTDGLVFHFIDVGQADCIAIDFPDGSLMVVDSGDASQDSRTKMVTYLENNFFANQITKTIDYFVITHPDLDHIGGAQKLLEEYQINKVYLPEVRDDQQTATFKRVLNDIDSEPSSTQEFTDADDDFSIGAVSINFCSPFYSENTYKTANNYSCVMIFSYQGKKVMLTGDAREDLEEEILNVIPAEDLNVDILKVGHHGSATSSSKEFLDAIDPEYAVISVGANNKFKHPTQEALDRLKDAGVTASALFRTDLNGNVVAGIGTGGEIAISVNYSRAIPVYISIFYIYGLVLLTVAIVFFIPKKHQGKALNLIKKKK